MPTSTGSLTTQAGPLDVQGIVELLMKGARQQQLNPLSRKGNALNAMISAYGSFQGALSTYQAALKGIGGEGLATQKASVANNGSATATTALTTDAFTADITGNAKSRAQEHVIRSDAIPSSRRFDAGDSLAIRVGTQTPSFITLKASASLLELRDAINQSKSGVLASIVLSAEGPRLELEATEGGSNKAIKIIGNNSLSGFSYDVSSRAPQGMSQVQAPRDASRAAAGSHAVEISQLAQEHKLGSAAIAAGTTFDQGILAIKTSKGSTVLIQPGNMSLGGLRDKINASDAGVNAAIISDGDKDFLLLTAKETGAANGMRITGTGKFAPLSFDPSGSLQLPAVAAGEAFGDGTLNLRVGPRETTLIPTDSNGDGRVGLDDVARTINTADLGVTASVTSKDGREQLVLVPQGRHALALAGSGSYAGLQGALMGQVQQARDARLSIDGVELSSSTNTVKDAINGVNLNLAKVTSGVDRFKLTVSNDNSGLNAAAGKLVNAYNTLHAAVAGLTRTKPGAKAGQASERDPLATESLVKSTMNALRAQILAPLPGAAGVQALAQIGLTFKKDGKMELDATRFDAAVARDFDGVNRLFSQEEGLLAKLSGTVDSILADKGDVKNKTRGLQSTLDQNNERVDAASKRLQQQQDRYTIQYNQLNKSMADALARRERLMAELGKMEQLLGKR